MFCSYDSDGRPWNPSFSDGTLAASSKSTWSLPGSQRRTSARCPSCIYSTPTKVYSNPDLCANDVKAGLPIQSFKNLAIDCMAKMIKNERNNEVWDFLLCSESRLKRHFIDLWMIFFGFSVLGHILFFFSNFRPDFPLLRSKAMDFGLILWVSELVPLYFGCLKLYFGCLNL